MRATPKRTAPITASAANCGQTTLQTGPAKQDALGQHDEMGGRRRQHDLLHPLGHALARGHAAGEHLQGQQHHDHQQSELRHGAGEGGQEHAQRGRGEQVQRRAAKEQSDRALDRHGQQALHDEV